VAQLKLFVPIFSGNFKFFINFLPRKYFKKMEVRHFRSSFPRVWEARRCSWTRTACTWLKTRTSRDSQTTASPFSVGFVTQGYHTSASPFSVGSVTQGYQTSASLFSVGFVTQGCHTSASPLSVGFGSKGS
jgi:hypothetical protein